MVEAKAGDRISLDAKKVGQPRRGGVVLEVRQGLSGARLEIEWDDGGRSILAPAAGILLVEGKGRKNGGAKKTGKAKAVRAKSSAPKKSGKSGKSGKSKKR